MDVADNPGVMARRDIEDVSWSHHAAGAIVCHDLHAAGQHKTVMMELAARRTDNRLYVLGPSPAWVGNVATDIDLVQHHDPPGEVTRRYALVGFVEALDYNIPIYRTALATAHSANRSWAGFTAQITIPVVRTLSCGRAASAGREAINRRFEPVL